MRHDDYYEEPFWLEADAREAQRCQTCGQTEEECLCDFDPADFDYL